MEFKQKNSIGEQMEKTGSNSRWSHGWRTISIATIVAAPRVTTPVIRREKVKTVSLGVI